jgi:hypothetical protein
MGNIYRTVLISCLFLVSIALSAQTHNWTINPNDYETDCEINAVVFIGSEEVSTGTLGAFVGDVCRGFADGMYFSGTGRTIFSVRCYSNNLTNPETLTFRYFDPSDNSYHTVIETVLFDSDEQIGNAMNPLLFHLCDPVTLLSGPFNSNMCAVSGSATFSVTAGGTSPYIYQWQYNTGTEWVNTANGIPSGAVYSGSNTASLNVSGITPAGDYQYRCRISNCHEWSSVTSNSATLTVDPLPGAAGTISGLTNVCPGQTSVAYNVPVIGNATTYSWSYSGTGAVISGTGNSVTISFATNATAGNLTVRGVNDCGAGTVSAGFPITVNPLPAAAGAIEGAATVCQGQQAVEYRVPPVTDATTYSWSYSGTGAVISGTGNSVTISFANNATAGNLIVRGVNDCGAGTVSAGFAVRVNPLPAAAGTIEGAATVCQGQQAVEYRVPPVTDATTYSWSYSGTGAVISGTGNSVTISFANNATAGNLIVRGVNDCGAGTVSAGFAVRVNPLPAAAGTIEGAATVCQGQQAVGYRVQPVADATTYSWSYSGTGAVINGTGNSVTISFANNATAGNLTVRGINDCGTGTVSAGFAVTINPLPAAAGAISGPIAVCQGQSGITYTVPAIANASSYVWTLPSGATGTSTTNSITVNYGLVATSGNVSVRGRNTCGDGALSTLPITVNPLPSAIAGLTMVPAGSSTSLTSSPSGGTWSSSVTAVATVNSSTGLLTGVSPGSTVITYRLPTGCSVSAEIDVLPADWNVIPANFDYEGRVTAAVFQENGVSEAGYLAAFAGDECRGIAKSVYLAAENIHIYELRFHSNTEEGDVLVFRHFNPAGRVVHNMNRSLDFESGMSTGSHSSPFRMGRGVDFEMNLPVGWTWLSINTILDNMTLNFILSTVSTPGDYIKDQTSSAAYYETYGWFGTITELDPTKLYKIRAYNISDFGFSGRPVDTDATPISLASGWNWIGYLPQQSIPINDALASLTPEEDDYIKDQRNSATFYSFYGSWFGNLLSMSPYAGYMLRISNPGTLLYPRSGSKGDEIFAGDAGIQFNYNDFEFNGSLTAKVLVDGDERGSENDLLYAVVNNEIRGVINGRYFEPSNTSLYVLMIHSNIEEGETVGFRYFDSENNKYYNCDETITFSSDMIVADAFRPLVLNFSGSDISDNFEEELKLSIYPNPFSHDLNIGYDLAESSHVRITLLDINGKVIRTLADQAQKAGTYRFTWNSDLSASGLYFIKFEAGNKHVTQKVILR